MAKLLLDEAVKLLLTLARTRRSVVQMLPAKLLVLAQSSSS
ncbi:hypothetical protein PC129_g12104 [Phytophthora cactorum]|uniref:Uncharacterized protein n=1 Tax=Phytophthora cactorum TaxID=29920 RepID=A0A8T1HY31_9STRA|nr:hypothetical protein Pcac1_g11504 [Phytophthora cactorum]KAG3217053.1 hypothetical protein PC129_g12104 [Phytophthora cactorum]KAG4233350.1 hypothetical protein PC116_g18451 [Phytophthora cactorum]